MKLFDYFKKNGFKRSLSVLWQYKIEILLEKIVLKITKNKK